MDLKSLKRKELQSLCKKHGISANIASSLMIEKLESILENEQKNQRRGCLKRSGESSSENLGVSQKNVTFVVDESKEIDEKPTRASKRKTVRARTETNTSENIATEAAKRTTRSKGLSESVLQSPVIEKKKKAKNGPKNIQVIAEENVTRPLRNRSVTVNDNDLKGGRKRKVAELNEETTTKAVEPSRSTRSRSKEDVKVETQSGKSSEKEEENVSMEVLPNRSRPTRSSKKLDENEDKKADKVQGNKRRKVDEVDNESVISTNPTHSSSSVLLDVGTCVFNPGKADEKRKVQEGTKVKRLTRGRIVKVEEKNALPVAEKSSKVKSEYQAKVAAVKPSRTTRGSSKVLKEQVSLPLDEAKEPKKEKVKEQEDDIIHAKRSTRSGLKASEDIAPAEKSRTLKASKRLTEKVAVANENVTTNVRSTRNISKNADDLDPVSSFGSGKKSGKQTSKVLAETVKATSPTSRSTRRSVKAAEEEILSPKIETGHKSVETVLSDTPSKTTRSSSRMSGKAKLSPKGGKHVSTPKVSATKSSSKLLGDVRKKQSATTATTEDVTTPTRSTRSSIKLDTSLEHGDSHHEIVMTSSRRSTQKVSKGSGDAEEAGNDKQSKNSKSSALKIDGDVQKTKDDRQTSIARISLQSTSKQGDTNVGKGTGKKRTRTTAMEDDSPVSQIKSSKRLRKGSTIEGKSSGIIASSIKQLIDAEALESDRVTETEPVESASLTETKAGNILDQYNVPESGPSQLDNFEDASGLNLGSNINENLSPENDLEKLPLKGKIIDESMELSVDNVTETEPLDSATLTEIKDGNTLDQKIVPELRPTQLDNVEDANGLNLGSSIDVSVAKVTEIELLESTTLIETETGNFVDQSNVPESEPFQLDNLEDTDGLNLGSSIDVSVEVTETEPLESVTLTEIEAGNILDRNNVPESRPSLLDNLEDTDGLNLGSSTDVYVDEVTETEPIESETVTGIKDGNVVHHVPESMPSQLDNLEDADGSNLGSGMNVSVDKVTETEPSESETLTEMKDGNAVDQNSVPESRPSQLDNLEDADGSNPGSTMNVYVDKVTETEPLESKTLTEIKDENVVDQNSVPESRPYQLDNLEEADGSHLGSSMNVSEDKVVETIKPLESVTLTESETENILDQNNVPEPRPSHLDNIENTNDLNLGSDINEHLSPKIDIEMVRLKGKTIDGSTDISVDNELKDIYKASEEPESKEGIGGSSENILAINEANKIDDATLYDSVEESELEEVSEAANANCSPCSPNLIHVASPMIEINTFNMDSATPAEAPNTFGKASEDYGTRTYDSGHFYNLEKKIGIETEIIHEGNEAINVDDLAVSPNVTSSVPSDVNLGEPTTAVNTLNLSQATLSFDPSFAEGDEHRQTPIEIEIGKEDTRDQLYTRPLTRESDFTSETESPTQKIDPELDLEETQEVEENTEETQEVEEIAVFVEDNSSSAFEKKNSENIDGTGLPKFADMSMNLERESSMEHRDELRDTITDDVLPKYVIPEQIQHETEICKVDLDIPSSTQLQTSEYNFISSTESPAREIGSQIYGEDTESIRENIVTTEGNNSSVPEKNKSEYFDDMDPSNSVDISMNIGVGDSSVQVAEKLFGPDMEEKLPKSSIPGSFSDANTSIDVSFEKETVFPKNDANIDGDGDTIMKEVNDSRQGDFDHLDEFSKNQDESLWQQYSVSITRAETPQDNISSFKENECGVNISSRVTSSVDVHEKDYDSKEIYIEDNNASIDFDLGMNSSTKNSLATPTASSDFEDEDDTQDESNRYQGSFGSFDQEEPFMVEETWVSRSEIPQVQQYVNDNADADQEENTEHDRTGFVSNISITEEFRNVSGISDAETQEVCSQEIGSPKLDNMFRDFEVTASAATQLSTQEERVISVQRSIEVSSFTEDVFSNVDSSKHEGSTTVENETKEITVTEMKESFANLPDDQEQRKTPDHNFSGSFSHL